MKYAIGVALLLTVMLAACSHAPKAPEATPLPLASPTAVPTATPVPTATWVPSTTPMPTETAEPTATAEDDACPRPMEIKDGKTVTVIIDVTSQSCGKTTIEVHIARKDGKFYLSSQEGEWISDLGSFTETRVISEGVVFIDLFIEGYSLILGSVEHRNGTFWWVPEAQPLDDHGQPSGTTL